MSAAVTTASPTTAPDAPASRSVRLIRVAVLLIAGLAIAFSATMHEQLGFDVAVVTASLAAIGAAHLIEALSAGAAGRRAVPALLAIVAFVAAAALPFGDSTIAFAIAIAAWSLVSALLEFIGAAVRPGSRADAPLVGGVGLLLAIVVLLVREDQVAVLGFFGAYAVIAGVFLGISAFDTRRDASK